MFKAKVLVIALTVLFVGPSAVASAEPTTPITYNAGTTATRFTGLAFDTCSAPTLAQMTAWKASPYKAVGIYFGGVNRTCAQPQLTPAWVASVTAMGWRLVPIYLGLQAPCGTRTYKMSTASSNRDAVRDADDAVAKAKALGLLPGSALYNDMENYDRTNAVCRSAVLHYLSSWTKELHLQRYVAGVYANLSSG